MSRSAFFVGNLGMVFNVDIPIKHNIMPFSDLCHDVYGRKIIRTTLTSVTAENIVDDLSSAIHIHNANAVEIDYLDRYYRGDQPILYREKQVRPEVNNKVVENLAQFIVDTKTAYMAGEPIQYVLHGTDESKSEEVKQLNVIMESEDKQYYDIELCRWRSICGTGYRFIGKNTKKPLLDEVDFYFAECDPRATFVVYDQEDNPAYGVIIRKDENNADIFNVYTNSEYFVIKDGKIVSKSINGNGAIPVIEYPNNARRLSDIEITISMTDEINKMASDRSNGIEQFVSSWVKFVNCEIDIDLFRQMRQEGALTVKSNNGAENKADVDVLSQELNQTESQVAVSDLFEKLLIVQGLANRQTSSSGDTKGAVELRNGHYDAENRAELSEPIFKRSERQMLRIILNRLRIQQGFSLLPSDVEVKISRTKADNILTKTESLQMMLQSGVNPARAIKTAGIWSDPEQVAIESKDRMDILYPTEIKEEVQIKNEVVDNGEEVGRTA